MRYTVITAIAFFAPNIPFLTGAPMAWVRGVITPMLAPTVPSGQGWITAEMFLHAGGSLTAVTALSVVALAALGIIYAATYSRLKGWTFFAPSLIWF